MTATSTVVAFAPGRVNLIGDHTDHSGGLVLPMAIQLGTRVAFRTHVGRADVELRSSIEPQVARVPLAGTMAETAPWARYVAAVLASVRPASGGRGTVTTTLPAGAGLGSSAALEVALALAFGHRGTHLELALTAQEAEHLASGVPCGIMDPLASAVGLEGHALLIDCTSLAIEPVVMPPPSEAKVVVLHSGRPRALAATAYAERRRQCEAAAGIVGQLRLARPADLVAIADPVVRARAEHVVGENGRVTAFAGAIRGGDLGAAGRLMVESHASLRDLFEVSTPELDDLCEVLLATPGVLGARLTGGGFGGCVVALCRPAAIFPAGIRAWTVAASRGAHLVS